MSGNLKIQILEIIIFEKFLKISKFVTFVILFVLDRVNTFQALSNAFVTRDGQTFGYYVWVTKEYVSCVRLQTQPNKFEKIKCKKSIFLVYGKILVIQFPYMKKY